MRTRWILGAIALCAVLLVAGTKTTSKMDRNSDPSTARENAWNLLPLLHNRAVDDIDTLYKFTTGAFQDSIYKTVGKFQRARIDTINATYGNFALFDTVKATSHQNASGARFLGVTKKYVIDYKDFDTTADNVTEQSIVIDSMPTLARIMDAWIINTVQAEDSGDANVVMSVELGITSGANELMAAANVDSINDIGAMSATQCYDVAPAVAKRAVFMSCTPDSVWLNLKAGEWNVYLQYNDNAGY